jgi:hypothetical protein
MIYYTAFPSSNTVNPLRPRPVDPILQLLEYQKDKDRCGIQPRPRWHPALEHEHRSLRFQRRADHTEG